jgi:predicted dehydrogenase
LFVCGRHAEKTERFAQSVGAEDYFLELEKAAADPRVQALTLALPHDVHRQAAETVAEARKHVLVEKPIATNLADADAMIAAAKRAGTILMVAEDMHFRPAIREAVACITRGDVGEPLYLLVHAGGIRRPQGWAAEKDRMGGGVLIDIGVHYVRGLRLLMGEPDRVSASRSMQSNTKMLGEDSVQLLFSSRYGWQAHMLLTWATNRGDLPDIVLAGDEGTLHLWPGKRFLDYYPVAPRVVPQAISYLRPYWLQEKLLRPRMQRRRITLPDRDGTGYLGEMEEFLAAVAEERLPATAPQDARRDLEIIQSAYEALAQEHWTEIPSLGAGQ